MVRLSIEEIIARVEQEIPFHAVSEDHSFTLKVEEYVPYVCAAVHDGSQFRQELWEHCLHTAYERWYEEDPCTKAMINSHPIVIAGCDSRFEYDLNRPPETAIYKDAWGKQLWKHNLPETLKERSLNKHNAFYRVVHALVQKLESKFPACIVYDIHSYNWKRWNREVPVWNLGTANVDETRYGECIEDWRHVLEHMPLPNGIKTTSKVNDTYQGNGYFLKFITQNTNNTLVLATEIAKVYCDELTQTIYPEVVYAVEDYLKTELKNHMERFYTKCKVVNLPLSEK